MHSKMIFKQFDEYVDKHSEEMPHIGNNDPHAVIFGEDQVHLDSANNKVKLPGMGWAGVEGEIQIEKISWIAVIIGKDDYEVILSEDGSPFSDEMKDDLPIKNGVIIAVPYGHPSLTKFQ